jgi:hypothetical protein
MNEIFLAGTEPSVTAEPPPPAEDAGAPAPESSDAR